MFRFKALKFDRNTAKYFRRLFGYVRSERRLLVLSVLFGVCGLCLPFFYPLITGLAIDHVVVPRPVNGELPAMEERMRWLFLLTLAAAVTAVSFAVVGYAKGHYTMQLGNAIVKRLRIDLYEHFQRLSLQFYAKERVGGIVWRIAHEVHGVIGLIYAGVLLLVFDLLQLLIAIGLLFSISSALTIAVLMVMPIYLWIFRRFNPLVQAASDAVGRQINKMSGNVHEQFSAVALVRTFAAEERESARFNEDNEKHHSFVNRQSHLGHLMGASAELLIHLGTTIIVGYGCYLAIHGDDPLTAGDITRFLGFAGILYGPIKRFADLNLVYQNSLASIRRVFRVFDIEPKIQDRADARNSPPVAGEIVFENVRFRYADDSDESRIRLDEDEPVDSPYLIRQGASRPPPKWVLDGLDFHIRSGSRVALVGPSGSGKTTLASLLPRLYEVQEGRILIDGVDVRDYTLKALRSAIAVVQQESFLFSGTIRENLIYGRPGADTEAVVAAARAAHADEFISMMPDGYETQLGERGVNLSGGQRQRLSIARAILKDPKILILDEATSALDTESERLVQDALERLMSTRTSLIIAHRLSTVRHADTILVLDAGRVVEFGSHDELVAHGGLYAKLVRQQFQRQRATDNPLL